MKSVLRIALTYFLVVPLQGWIGVIGVPVLLVAALGTTLASPPNAVVYATVVGSIGVALMVVVPTILGGAALRYASSPTVLHLRPNGRVRMLTGTTLAITVVAALTSLPATMVYLIYVQHGLAPKPGTLVPGEVFAFSWSLIVLLWLTIFIVTSSRLLAYVAMLAPLIVMQVARHFAISDPRPSTMFAIGLGAWAAFVLYYLKANSFKQPQWVSGMSNQTFENTPLGMLMGLFDSSRGPVSRQFATSKMLLGVGSPLRFGIVLSGWFMLFIFAMSSFSRHSGSSVMAPDFPLSLMAAMGGTMAWLTTSRARFLWLRAGSDRADLFAIAERCNLITAFSAVAVTIVALIAITFVRDPEQVPALLLFSVSQLALCACMLYGGMSITRGWTLGEILLCGGLGVVFIIQTAVLHPVGKASMTATLGVTGIHLLLTALLRQHARNKWLKLDWRVARMPSMIRRSL